MKAILLKKTFSPEAAQLAGFNKFEEDVVGLADRKFEETHASWSAENTPDAYVDVKMNGNNVTWLVGRDGLIYCYVSRGVESYIMESSTPMWFQSEYTPATKRGSTASGPKSRGGGWQGPLYEVEHHAEPRDFDVTIHEIVKKYIPTRTTAISKAMAKAIWQ